MCIRDSKYTHIGEVVEEEIRIDKSEANLSIFPMPSSHAKGSLALMADETYCLLGDALYPAHKGNKTVYNAGMVKQQIDLLNKIPASYILLSHREPVSYTHLDVYKRQEPEGCCNLGR